jgi:chromate transport protein ChrA
VPDRAIAGREVAGRRDLAAAVGVGIGTALALSWQILRLPPEVHQFQKYPAAALQFLHGASPPERLLDFSPLYLGLHIAVFRLFPNPTSWIAAIQIGLLALAAALLYRLLRRTVGAPFAWVGVAAFALNTSLAIYGYLFEPESLMALLLVALALAATRDSMAAAAAMERSSRYACSRGRASRRSSR